ncbi:unnamed protein product [Rhizoctonia solani]|uniref:Alpha,alpha-trehalose-phosphate synthase (UDP-forming) n=1 Tax=Rhizoctonia solani TaxID=456999 RepID=A0A8H2WG03_9AGAM|nr:unnamed protein product [Rhizoctonia solani]CAE6415474.1 unnamed protein product [Rhizoctonia solani]
MEAKEGQRLIVVSNRLPITISKDAKGEYHFKMSSGGLVSALSGCKKSMSFIWIGWTGLYIPPKDRALVDKRLMEEYSCQAVYLDDDLADRHYNGFSNSILWPLFHYHPGEMNFDEANWLAYRQANLKFAESIRSLVRSGDMVWVQDYHLMLLPMLLRGLVDGPGKDGSVTQKELAKIKEGIVEATPEVENEALNDVKIGFFLHTPFPRAPTMPNGIEFEGRYSQVGTFPIGIDPDQFVNNLAKPSVKERVAALEQRFKGVKIIVGVDRLDYIKGVVLVQLAVPSRQDVEEYQNLRSTVNELVGRINGRFGTVEFMPIHFMHKSLAFDELCALYAVSDVCLVTSTRDGMNLVSYEYIACQQERQGAMILSEFAGAAQSLNGSIVVNPWDSQQVADAIHEAVTMSPETRAENQKKLFKYVTKYSSAYWGTSFVREMSRLRPSQHPAVPPESGGQSADREGEALEHGAVPT